MGKDYDYIMDLLMEVPSVKEYVESGCSKALEDGTIEFIKLEEES